MKIKKLRRIIPVQTFAIAFSTLLVWGCGKEKEKTSSGPDPLLLKYAVRATWAHDQQAFIQGLVIHDGKLYESTGQEGESWIGVMDINSGKPDKKVTLESKYFGEGITILNDKIYQLTWKTKVGFIYDLDTFKKIGEFTYDTEGWGLTHNGTHLIKSDGTDKIVFMDTTSLKPVKTLHVTDASGPVRELNELEFIDGFIYANVWQTSFIVKIDPNDGKVVGKLDLSSLTRDAKMRNPQADVLNGIAYHPTTKLMVVTGKYWPLAYVIKVG